VPLIHSLTHSLTHSLCAFRVICLLQPNFKRLTEQQSELEGNYRTSHSRLIANSEEISFLGGANLERKLMTNIFDQLFEHCRLFASKRAWIGCIDQYLIKYGSSVTGYLIMCLPVFFPANNSSSNTVGQHTRDFVRNRQVGRLLGDRGGDVCSRLRFASVFLPKAHQRCCSMFFVVAVCLWAFWSGVTQLLMDLASAVGTLLSTTNKVASLAGSTSRVGEVW
jgi:ABC-type uncharacterized transport system fused permease/ATPase subunit